MGFIDDHYDVMAVLSDTLSAMVGEVDHRRPRNLELDGLALQAVPVEIPTIHFSVAQEMVEAATGSGVVGEPDVSPSDERWIGQWALCEFGSDFVFVVRYPMDKRPFYRHQDPQRPEFSNSFDLLFRGTELVTGGQRLHRSPITSKHDQARIADRSTAASPHSPWDATPRRICHWSRAVDGPHHGSGERPRSHALSFEISLD